MKGGAAGAGRSTAIVLFTDLVGSTELRTRLGEDVAELVRREHDVLVADAVEASRGHVVKNLGDGIMATFAGASDAVGAAVAIQQAIGRRNRPGAAALAVRIGISAGDVVFEGSDCFGLPVIEAARLCGAAAGGQILASEMMRWLARSSEAKFTAIGSLELRGLAEPVPAVDVDWEPLAQSAIPFPTFLTDIGRIFVGREGELEALKQSWKEAAAGGLRVALLAGEPGAGKTRLGAELARTVHDEGAMVLVGRCDEDLGVPYQPFVEALRHFVDHAPELGHRLGRYGEELSRLVPELRQRLPGLPAPLRSDPNTERYRLFDAVAAWLAAASGEEPLLLVLDDLQWAAKPTLLLLRHVVRAAGGRILIVGTYRDTEMTHDHPLVELVADLRREGGVERLSLSGLDDVGVVAMVEQAVGRTLDDEDLALARAVYEETEGNPFFVREVLRLLAETGADERRATGWTARSEIEQLGVPESVRDVIGRRLARLSNDTNHALRVAAVVGPEFELGVVRAAGDFDEEALLGAVEEAGGARLVTEVSATRFRFAHALVRATLYDALTSTRKVTLHHRVAEAIETIHARALDDHLPALAHHWARAAPRADVARAVEYARRAGDRALAQLAHDEAVTYYQQALDLLEADDGPADDGRRLELLISLGEAQRRTGDAAHRKTLLDAARLARDRGDADALALAALANSRGTLFSAAGVVDADRVEMLEAALEVTGDTRTRIRLLATIASELVFDDAERQRRVRLSAEALAIARDLGDESTLAHVLIGRFTAMWQPGSLGERLESSAELLAIADGLGEPVVRVRAWWLRCRALLEVGSIEEARDCLDVVETITSDLGQPALRWYAGWTRVGLLLFAGDIDGAERLNEETLTLGEAAGQPDAQVFFSMHQFQIRFDQGRLGELEQQFVTGLARNPGLPLYQAMLALIYSELDRKDDARRTFEPLAESRCAALPLDLAWLKSVTHCAQVAAYLGDQDSALVLYERLVPYADQLVSGAAVLTGSVSHYLGLLTATLGRHDKAEEHFAAAAVTHGRLGGPAWLARTRLEWANMQLNRQRSGDAKRARELLLQALDTARELGLRAVERRAFALLG